jgi:hypothetical protein
MMRIPSSDTDFLAFAWELIKENDLSKMPWRHFVNGALRIWFSSDIYLHIWHPDLITVPSDEHFSCVHDHRFVVRSVILKGSITDVHYDTTPSSSGNATLHEIDFQTKTSHLVGSVEGREISRRTYQEGDVYIIPKAILHDTFIEGPAITMIHASELDDLPARQLQSSKSGTTKEQKAKAAKRLQMILRQMKEKEHGY